MAGYWLMIDSASKQVIGDIGFKGKPDHGTVEIGYSVVPARRRQGYGFEAAQAIAKWAFSHNEVGMIKAECEKDIWRPSIYLEKLGMFCLAEDEDLLQWELYKTASHRSTIS